MLRVIWVVFPARSVAVAVMLPDPSGMATLAEKLPSVPTGTVAPLTASDAMPLVASVAVPDTGTVFEDRIAPSAGEATFNTGLSVSNVTVTVSVVFKPTAFPATTVIVFCPLERVTLAENVPPVMVACTPLTVTLETVLTLSDTVPVTEIV